LLEDVGALQKDLLRGKLHEGFVQSGRLFGDNILLHRTPIPKHSPCKLFLRHG